MLSVYDKTLNRYICNPVDTSLNEVATDDGYIYKGKTKNLQQVEKIIGKMMYDFKNEDDGNQLSSLGFDNPEFTKKRIEFVQKVSTSPELAQICKLLEDEFGLKEVKIYINPATIINAFHGGITDTNMMTIPSNYFIRDITTGMPSLLYNDGKFYDKKHEYYLGVKLLSGFLDKQVFTPDETMAVLMHEIGHNFVTAIESYAGQLADYVEQGLNFVNKKNLFTFLRAIATAVHIPAPKIVMKTISTIDNYIMNNSPAIVFAIANWFTKMLMRLEKYNIFVPISILQGRFDPFRNLTPQHFISSFLKFSEERAADSFVTVCGYGPSLVSCLNKWQKKYDLKDTNILLDSVGYMGETASTIRALLFDEHPEQQTRMRMILDDIKELNDQKESFPPHIQTLIEKDYKDTKKAYEEFLNVDKDPRQVFFLEKLTRAFKDTILFGRIDLRSYILHSSMIRMTLLQRLANKIRGGQ